MIKKVKISTLLVMLHLAVLAQNNSYPISGNPIIYDYSPGITLQRNTDNGGFTQGIQTKLADGTNNWYFGALHQSRFVINKGDYQGENFTIMDNGNIGIGTDSPTEKLTIAGGNIKIHHNRAYLLHYGSLSETASGASTILGNNVVAGTDANTIKRNMHPIDNGSFVSLNYYHGITFHTGVNSPQGVDVPMYDSEKMRIDQNGNVGIGTANPLHVLHLRQSRPTLNFEKAGILNWTIGNLSDNDFYIQADNAPSSPFVVQSNSGNVGIGTATPKEKLSVNGKIRAKEIKVEATDWPDYVFEDSYQTRSLTELEQYIKQYKHLPEVPSAKEVEENGVALGEMNKILLKKIEELTLHLIEKDKSIRELTKRVEQLEDK